MKCLPTIFQLSILALIFLIRNDDCSAASFDCNKAQASDEKLICMSDDLSKKDEDLANKYKFLLANLPDTTQIKKDQKNALKNRKQCQDRDCLESWFNERQKYLDDISNLNLGDDNSSQNQKLAINDDDVNKCDDDPIYCPFCSAYILEGDEESSDEFAEEDDD